VLTLRWPRGTQLHPRHERTLLNLPLEEGRGSIRKHPIRLDPQGGSGHDRHAVRAGPSFQFTAEEHYSFAHADQSFSAAIYAYWWGNGGTCDRAVVADLHIQVVL